MVLRITGVIVLITLLINIIISLSVFFRGRNKRANRIFALFVLNVAFWNLCNFFVHSIQSQSLSSFWMKMALIGPVLIPFFFILFSVNFPIKRKISRNFLLVLLIPTFILLFLSPTALNVKDLTIESWGANFTPGFLYIPFTIYFIFYMGIGLYFLSKSYQEVVGRQRMQILYVFLGVLIAASLGIIMNAVLPLLGISRLDPVGSPSSLIFTIAVSYAILRYRLLDVKVILRKGLIYVVLFSIILAIYVLGILLVQSKLADIVNAKPDVILYIALIISAISFTPLKRFVQKCINRVFFRDFIDFSARLDRFQEKTKGVIQLESLTERVAQEVRKAVPVSKVCFLIKDKKENIFHEFVSNPTEKGRRLSFDNSLVSLLMDKTEIVIKEELDQPPYPLWVRESAHDRREIRRLLKGIGASLCLPILDDEQLIGIIVLGERGNQKAFTNEELSYLKSLSLQVSFALASVLIYHYALLSAMKMAKET